MSRHHGGYRDEPVAVEATNIPVVDTGNDVKLPVMAFEYRSFVWLAIKTIG